MAGEYRQLTGEVIHSYASSGERRYADGLWENGDPSCWYCNVGPAVGAAYLAEAEPSMLPVAIDSLDRAIAEYRQADGSFTGNTSPAIASAAFGVTLGLAYVRLEHQLPAATRSLWQETLTGIGDYLVRDHDATWYANGNINCSYAASFYFAWRASGEQRFAEDYEAELAFMVAPPGKLWEGFGLLLTQQPTVSNGSDGRGFLTEGSPPGWDPEYSHLQLDYLAALYSASQDPRVLRLLNLILNQELTRVDPSTFILDARGGTRKDELIPFTSAALPLLVIDGKRPDLAPLLPAAFERLASEYRATFTYTNHNFYRGAALWLAPILLASSGLPPIPAPLAPPAVGALPGAAGATPARATVPGAAHPASGGQRAGAQPQPPPRTPALSPLLLGASRVQPVVELEVPGAEYAFATATALTGGVPAPRRGQTRLTFAAFVCTRTCTLAIRPLLVIHRAGAATPVIRQEDLAPSLTRLAPGQPFVSRVSVPRSALYAARHGHRSFVRLRVKVRTRELGMQGRSYMFKLG